MYNIIKIIYKDNDGNCLDHKYVKTQMSQEEVNEVIDKYKNSVEYCLDATFVGQIGEFSCNGLTDREKEIIESNLDAYINNFDYIQIEKHGKEFFIYKDPKDVENENYIQRCSNINYINGWLYGAVQANNKVMCSIR